MAWAARTTKQDEGSPCALGGAGQRPGFIMMLLSSPGRDRSYLMSERYRPLVRLEMGSKQAAVMITAARQARGNQRADVGAGY